MTMPLHPIRTYENRVELGSVKSWDEFNDLSGFKSPKSFAYALNLDAPIYMHERKLPLKSVGEEIKEANKILARNYGPRIHKNLPAAMYNTFIKSNFNYSSYFALRRTGRHWKKWDKSLVRKAVKHKEIIQQLEKDKAEHLIPACLHFEMDPSEVRGLVGRSAWRKIANNSKTRNRLIFAKRDFHEELLDLRSSVLYQLRANHSIREIVAAKITPTSKDFHRTTRIVVDTFFMASELGKTVNPNWSYKRFLKEHDKLSRETLTKTYPDEPFCESHVEEIRGYTFCRLTSEFQIALEGKEMRHCVASYASAARAGRYEVYKVEGGRERATLGLYVDRMGKVFFDQMFGPRNTYVSDLIGTAAREFIVKENEGEDTAGRRSGRLSRQGR